MNGLERESAESRACLAAETVLGLMCDLLADESLRRNGGKEINGDYDYTKRRTMAEISKALRDAEKVIKDAINSEQAEAWLGLCVDLACKSLSSAQSDDKATARSTANECIGTCIEAARALNVHDENLCEPLGF